ncbi:MAG: hypothetical protein D6802_07435 [Ardenticatenia bacterium]|nr:MAG: hypothetical protein D6802_07435 [Ardenticatenia bacterium]
MRYMHRINQTWVSWVSVLVLLALLGLAVPGIGYTHDGYFHAYRILGLREALTQGVWYPRFFPEFSFGYGFPVLHYYAPLAYYVGLLPLLVGRGAALALDFSFAVAVVLATWSMGWLVWRLWQHQTAALLAALTYTYLPYHLADIYQRGALAETWAFVWWPLLLGAVWEHRLVLLAISTAGLLLTHNLSVLLILPVIGLWMLALAIQERKVVWRRWAQLIGAALVGSGVAAFYWIPALLEMKWVRVGHERGSIDPTEFLAPLHQLSQLEPKIFLKGIFFHPVQMLLLGSVFVLLVVFWAHLRQRLLVGVMAGVLLITYVLQTPWAAPLWRMVAPLQWLQFPWRWMGIAVLCIAFLVGAVSTINRRIVHVVMSGLVIFLIITMLPTTFIDRIALDTYRYPQEMWRIDQKSHSVGATWKQEFLPLWVRVPPDELYQSGPARPQTASPIRAARLLSAASNTFRLAVETDGEATLSLHQFYMPHWRALRNETEPLETFPLGDLGLVATRLPAGTQTLTLAWGATPTVRLATWVSLATTLGGLLWLWRKQRRSVLATLVAGGLFAAGVWGYHARHHVEVIPINATFAKRGWLLGWQPQSQVVEAGRPFHLTLFWLNRRTMPTDYNIFIHITRLGEDVPVAQYDGYPNSGLTPTTRWEAGEIVISREVVELPETLSPGIYDVWAGMYDWRTLERWPVVGREDGRIYLGTIEIRK